MFWTLLSYWQHMVAQHFQMPTFTGKLDWPRKVKFDRCWWRGSSVLMAQPSSDECSIATNIASASRGGWSVFDQIIYWTWNYNFWWPHRFSFDFHSNSSKSCSSDYWCNHMKSARKGRLATTMAMITAWLLANVTNHSEVVVSQMVNFSLLTEECRFGDVVLVGF